ncbi:helix-turn-helix transcriptional regulator [Pseudoteredinibacter isoporae]|uniref:Putative DNA-binding transcriptional regulator YafY n=1 Tax=Pseudoteredinibacter isoporae TaxID=570281 RepID=A0A7X0MWV0_9GAMM|nr:YafY family protein [Pseudoteredinibacter isoporae]MBB6521374.1 putative DNA-binding transcriptional regulator YafY [Pseudoteredinibacter isoporae]NHO86929.1 YafY family transcriptional regulator [Pseudoteredinibacter isoporae]NIB24618.1 YafY family transcriptional regulator [Pseudoteredinibacter isoporae]
MNKAERLLKLLTLLQSRRRAITAAQMADKLNVSERTIYRDIQALELSGVPISGEAGVGYMLQAGSTLAPLMFNESELEALILGVRMVQAWGDQGLADSADQALDKIRAILPDRQHYLHSIAEETLIVPDLERDQSTRHSQELRRAIKQQEKITIDYQDEKQQSSQRTIWPLGLVYWGKVWTLVSWCELRADYRSFRIDRIQGLENSGETFETSDEISLKHYLAPYRCS